MIKNYIKTALRNLWKGRVFNFMNVLGLSIAITCCTLLFLTINYEFSFDKFHKNLPDIYQFYLTANRADKIEKNTPMPVPLAPAVKADYQDIQRITRVANGGSMVRYGDKQIGQRIHFVDEDFLKIFTFPVINGDTNRPLKDLNNVVISEVSAKALFGKTNPVGKTIELMLNNKPQSFVVTAVIKDIPDNSSINFDMLLRFECLPQYHSWLNQWDHQDHSVFVQLNSQTNAADFERRLQPFMEKHFAKAIKDIKRDGSRPDANGNVYTLNLMPFVGNHFNTEMNGVEGTPISKFSVVSLLIIGLFILLIACINFINLSVARSFTRAREVGVRKTLGASKWQLLSQFWVETIMVCLAALVLGLVLATIVLSGLKATFKSNISLGMLLHPAQLLIAIGLFVLITFSAGFYPAMLMLRYKTVAVLKGTINNVKPGKVRNTLLVVQFAISTLLIICTLTTWRQVNYLQNRPLGYNKSEVISIPTGNGVDGGKYLKLFRNVVNGDPNVISLTGAYDNLGRGIDGSTRTSVNGFTYKGHEIRTYMQLVDYDYIKTLDIKLMEGRDFSRDFATDTDAILVNEQMAKLVSNKSALNAGLPMDDVHPMRVIGVFKNYNFHSLHENVAPLTLFLDKGSSMNYIFIKMRPGNLAQGFDDIKNKWKATFPTVDFKGSWLSENTENQYQKEKRLSVIFISSAIIAILISCIGLVAISVMIMVQRTKEIGIRKVLGSSTSGIVLLLSVDFIKLVGLAALISFPVGWWLMKSWLNDYAYRITLQWWVFALAGVIAVVIAFVTISFQSIRAAVANPVKSLRSE